MEAGDNRNGSSHDHGLRRAQSPNLPDVDIGKPTPGTESPLYEYRPGITPTDGCRTVPEGAGGHPKTSWVRWTGPTHLRTDESRGRRDHLRLLGKGQHPLDRGEDHRQSPIQGGIPVTYLI